MKLSELQKSCDGIGFHACDSPLVMGSVQTYQLRIHLLTSSRRFQICLYPVPPFLILPSHPYIAMKTRPLPDGVLQRLQNFRNLNPQAL